MLETSEDVCHTDLLPDEGGLAYWGCPRCTPGCESPHYLGCELIGWHVPLPLASRVGDRAGSAAVIQPVAAHASNELPVRSRSGFGRFVA